MTRISKNGFKREIIFYSRSVKAAAKMGFKRTILSATDSNGTGNNQERTHNLVNPSQKAGLSAGLVSNRYQSSVVLRMSSIQSQGSERLELLIQRKLTELDESGKDAWRLPPKMVCKVSTSATSPDRGGKTMQGFYLVSGFANAKKEHEP